LVKQLQPQHQDNEEVNPLVGEKIGADLLLRDWDMALDVVNRAIEHNKKSGARYHERFTVAFFDHMEPMEIRKKKNWLNACTNSKTNTPYTLDSLINAQIVSEDERELFGDLPLPRRELIRLVRVQLPTDKSEWLLRGERWYGLNKSAGIVTISVYDLDYTRRISVTREYADRDPERPGNQVLVQMVGDSKQWITAERIYLTPFNKETVQQAMINAGPPTEKSLRGRIHLILDREGTPNPKGLTPENNNIDTFVNKSFDELFDVKPAPTTSITNINIDPKDLEAFLKYKQLHEKDHQYQ
jgi:hypothetical protein